MPTPRLVDREVGNQHDVTMLASPAPPSRDGSGPQVRLGLRLTLAVVSLVLVAIPFGLLLLEVLFSGPLTRVDEHIATEQNLENLADHHRVTILKAVTQLGSTVTLATIVVLTAAFLLAFRKRRRQALFLATTAVLGLITNNLIKVLVGRARPHFDPSIAHAFGKSFPSGHTMNSTVVYGSLLVVAWVRLRTWPRRIAASVLVAALVGAIATSRVALGVHYLSDVLAGIVLGTALVLASAAAFTTWQQEGGHLPAAIEDAPGVDDPADDRAADERSNDPRSTPA